MGVGCDVSDPDAMSRLVSTAEDSFGPIDVFCSNADFTDPAPGDLRQPVSAWRRIVEVNLMAHVWAARAELRAPRDPGVVPVPERRLYRHVRPAAGR